MLNFSTFELTIEPLKHWRKSIMNNDTPTIFVSGLTVRTSPDDKMVILGLVDALSSSDETKKNYNAYHFALPPSIITKLSQSLNEACEDLEIEINNQDDLED